LPAKSGITLITTEDGSHSLYVPELEETYHSVHGAIRESQHVFLEAGLACVLEKKPAKATLNILEFGFGTGLNALLTAIRCEGTRPVNYHSLEKYPLTTAQTAALNYGKLLCREALFGQLHACPWEKTTAVTDYFTLKKINIDFRDYKTRHQYDLIYFDAFAPGKQPELWDKGIFRQCYALLSPGGVLVTYSANGQLKRDLSAIGFTVAQLPGPPGKRAMTRAVK